MFTLPHRLDFILTLLLSVLLLTGCGGGGGSSTSDDTDGDGYVNSVDVDDDNDGLIEISSLQQLDWMRNDLAGTSLTDNDGNVNSSGCPVGGCYGYELVADLDFDTNGDGVMDANDTYDNNGSGWLPIGDSTYHFTADFNGNGHTIRNLYIYRPTETYNGLFGVVDGTNSANVIQNVNLENILVTSYYYTGGLVGYIFASTISNSSASGAVEGNNHTGGLVGYVDSSTISNSSANGVITGKVSYTGGLVGIVSDSTISNSSASGTIEGNYDTGGLVGFMSGNNSSIRNSSASGAVTGKKDVTGGLVGFVRNNSSISNSSASGAVTGSGEKTGGLVGQVNSSSANTTVIIENSFATGSVTATTGNFVGGLIGHSFQLTLNNTFATGKVDGVRYVGALIGDANTGTVITDNFATGKVTGSSELGALVGWSDGASYSANYFANNKGIVNAIGTNYSTPGNINPAGTTGATLAELQCPTTANDTTCTASRLYDNWSTALWDFGSDSQNSQLPGLIIDGTVYRDGNGDGVLD